MGKKIINNIINNNNNIINNNIINDIINDDIINDISFNNKINDLNKKYNKKTDDSKKTDDDNKKFNGTNILQNNHSECVYCGNYFIKEMKLNDSCCHCWAWCNGLLLDVINFTYSGFHNFNDVKKFLKYTYKYHPSSCKNNDCAYYKISKAYNENKLNKDLLVLLDLPNKNSDNVKKYTSILDDNRNISINFKLSSIKI
jgi:hypothetical protein